MKTKNVIILMALLAGSAASSFGQSQVNVFTRSYENEQNQNFLGAIRVMNEIYDENSYEINLRLGWLHYEAADFQKSIMYYKKAIQLNPTSVEPKIGLSYPLGALDLYDDLIKNYEEILKLDPKNTIANYWLGYIYYVRKENKKAYEYTIKVTELYPFDYDANFLLGRIYVAQGKIDEAKLALTKAQLYNPKSTYVSDLLKKL